ncbi:MAG: PAS domain S-box protein [Anaerocolumna aminovalerica]|jgi:diguanylate cyclase (GGDEF)-like protein/PAS domain S-box-containing protein|uniref:HD domain-containing phosphohydrolase n=1 Tax=Anaerocolumna aminovalerica TaxID=1527 RepID=UPI002911BE1A|nr:HD domain-containing phosphohydrolase [Anaerocolumna aminovalerica]MDU6266334.1 PAS domain S-box protein [Anaerocolumna aminovalerica]
MSDNGIQNVQDILPFGIGYLKLLMNSQGEVEDYILLDINNEFERLTNLKRKDILGKRASEVFCGKKLGNIDWNSYYGSVVRTGKTQETTEWMEEFQRYLKITVIPADEILFAIIIRDTNEESIYPSGYGEAFKSPEDLEIVFNSTHDAVALLEFRNNKYRYIRNNIVHQRYTGFSNIKDVDVITLVGEKVGARLVKYFDKCVSTGKPISYEQEFNFAPGKRIWQTEVTPIFNKDKVCYLLCSSKDVSELKNIREEHEVLTHRFQAMFDQHSAIKVVFDAATGEIVDVNPAACNYFGYAKAEVLGQRVQEFNLLPHEIQDEKFQSELNGEILFSAAPHRLKNGETRFLDVYASAIMDGERRLLYAILFDVTDREHYRDELFQEKELLKTTLRSIGDGVVTTDNNGIITSLNSVAQELTGWDNSLAVGRPFTDVFILQNEETGHQVESPIQKVLETGRIIGLANHTELLNLKGQYIPIADSAAPIKTEDGQTFGVVMVFRDVSDEKEHSKQIQFLSYHDTLTGLYNRRYAEEILNQLDSAENLPLSVIMGDVNGLKITNDVFGHKSGDSLLQHVAGLLEKHCKKDDLIVRWGGDEFVVFMTKTDSKSAEKVIQRIKSDHVAVDGSNLHLSLSLGCAVKDTKEKSIEAVLREAEEYMYHQKLLDGKSYRNAIINTLLATLYEKSMETEEHSKRMESYCHSIGRKLQLSSKEMDELSLLALLHDVGKVGINPDILKKPSSLTPVEWDEMKRHPEIGYRIAQATPELAIVSDLILYHHERWDGKGYPRGLKGEEIPLPCRILAVTDAYDAMTNDRVYRKAMSREEALLEIERNAGTQFDPYITSLFIKAIVDKNYRI